MADDIVYADMSAEFLPKPPRNLEMCQRLAQAGYKPYATVMVRGKAMEAISMPFVQDGYAIRGGGCGIGLMVREKDDPTTMVEWSIPINEVRAVLRNKLR